VPVALEPVEQLRHRAAAQSRPVADETAGRDAMTFQEMEALQLHGVQSHSPRDLGVVPAQSGTQLVEHEPGELRGGAGILRGVHGRRVPERPATWARHRAA